MPQRYIDTTLFDLFKVGPGPSSSHTIGPMKAGHHFAETCAALPRDLLVRAVRFRVRLYGSLSATVRATGPTRRRRGPARHGPGKLSRRPAPGAYG